MVKYYPINHICFKLLTQKVNFSKTWLKKVGYSADYIVRKAADEGTQVHEMCEDYLNGKKN